MKKLLFFFIMCCYFSCIENDSDEKMIDGNSQMGEKKGKEVDVPSNYNLIKDNLFIFIENQRFSKVNETYSCSESGGAYQSQNYLNSGYTLPDLEDYMESIFNQSGTRTHSTYISMEFDIYGADEYYNLDQIAANRLYNEFICRLKEEIGSVYDSRSVLYQLYFTLDYLLCCDGSVCCYPIFEVEGWVRYN